MIPLNDILGYIGGFFIAISFLPQAVKSYRTKKVNDISLLTLSFSILGTVLWIAYSLRAENMPLLLTNAVFLSIVAFEIFLKMQYGKQARKRK